MRIRLILIGSIKFWWIAAFLVVLDIIQIPISNPGGHLAHLGGAAFGYLYASQLGKGNDIASGFEKFMDWVASLFSSSPRAKKSPLKTVHRKKKSASQKTTTSTYSYRSRKNEEQEKIDAILDKISKSGYDSLSKQEKDFLFNAGKNN